MYYHSFPTIPVAVVFCGVQTTVSVAAHVLCAFVPLVLRLAVAQIFASLSGVARKTICQPLTHFLQILMWCRG